MKRVISIDLGGTNLKAALVDREARIIRRLTLPTTQAGRSALCEQLAAVITDLGQGEQIHAVGIGTPGFVNSKDGKVLLATNLPGWSGTNVKTELQNLVPWPVKLANDANVAALGEAWVGAGQQLANFFLITLGTGVGGSLFTREQGLWTGASHRGGEVGHAILYPGGKPCLCGQYGCVEQYLSGRSLEHNYMQATKSRLSAFEIFIRGAAGTKPARAIVDKFCFDLATLLTSLTNVLDPVGFIIGGGLVHARRYWWQAVQHEFARQCVHGNTTLLLPAANGNSAGLLGAAYLAWGQGEEKQNASNN